MQPPKQSSDSKEAALAPYGHLTSGGIDIRMASIVPTVFSPNVVPRSYSRLNSTYRPRRTN